MDENFYKAKVIRVVDGDTIDLKVKLGWEITKKIRVRLYGIDTPEVRTKNLKEKAAGIRSSNWMKKMLPKGAEVKILTIDYGKFGRTLVKIFLIEEDGSLGECLNDRLVELGLASVYLMK